MNTYDSLNRPLRDLRISVTDRCNFRCTYCMPKEIYNNEYNFLKRDEILTFEEIYRISKIFVSLGIHKIRITGGEPLLRKNLYKLIDQLNTINDIDIALTTNGVLLKQQAQQLFDSGLRRITISLDAVDDNLFKLLSDSSYSHEDVLRGIEKSLEVGFKVKINMVVKRGINDQHALEMIEFFRNSNVIIRFIEFMDVGSTNHWNENSVMQSQELLKMIENNYKVNKLEKNYFGEVANRYELQDKSLEFGFISSVTEPFCSDCTRIRLSSDGKLYTCLFSLSGFDIKEKIRSKNDDKQIINFINSIWTNRNDRYSELRNQSILSSNKNKIEMPYIGG
ncbi:MAG: GTP 3',8-cyclase MoaA [Chloroflexi bacterium]|nr:GTP 3',8-cyclase MoaA [Chloroflexota bacterium]